MMTKQRKTEKRFNLRKKKRSWMDRQSPFLLSADVMQNAWRLENSKFEYLKGLQSGTRFLIEEILENSSDVENVNRRLNRIQVILPETAVTPI